MEYAQNWDLWGSCNSYKADRRGRRSLQSIMKNVNRRNVFGDFLSSIVGIGVLDSPHKSQSNYSINQNLKDKLGFIEWFMFNRRGDHTNMFVAFAKQYVVARGRSMNAPTIKRKHTDKFQFILQILIYRSVP